MGEGMVILGSFDHSSTWTVPSVSSCPEAKRTCISCGLSSAFNYVSGFVICALCSAFGFYLGSDAATMRIKEAPDPFPFVAFLGISSILLTVFELLLLCFLSKTDPVVFSYCFPLALNFSFTPANPYIRNAVSVHCRCQARAVVKGGVTTSLLWAAASQRSLVTSFPLRPRWFYCLFRINFLLLFSHTYVLLPSCFSSCCLLNQELSCPQSSRF